MNSHGAVFAEISYSNNNLKNINEPIVNALGKF